MASGYSGVYVGSFSGWGDDGEAAVLVDANNRATLLAYDYYDDAGIDKSNIVVKSSDGSFSIRNVDGYGTNLEGSIRDDESLRSYSDSEGQTEATLYRTSAVGPYQDQVGYYRGNYSTTCFGDRLSGHVSAIISADGLVYVYGETQYGASGGLLTVSDNYFYGYLVGEAIYVQGQIAGSIIIVNVTSNGCDESVSLTKQKALLAPDLGGAELGRDSVTCDFDNDGYTELAVGAPSLNVVGVGPSGYVSVVSETYAQNLIQGHWGLSGSAEPGDRFGHSLAAGDFNGDGFCDLAVGVPGEEIKGVKNAGGVAVIYGSELGLNRSVINDKFIHLNSSGIKGINRSGNSMGESLLATDFNQDGFVDLAIGIKGADVSGKNQAGAVLVIYGGERGLAADDQFWSQSSPGIKGAAEPYDFFGETLASGDFDGNGYPDLVIGIPGEDVGRVKNAGAIQVLYGYSNGLTNTDLALSRNSRGIKEKATAFDYFGRAVATGDFDYDGFDDLAVGAPKAEVNGKKNAGMVHIIYGSNSGITRRDQVKHEDSSGIKGYAEKYDYFGSSLAASDLDGDGYSDLVIGIPGENVGSIKNAGSALLIYGGEGGVGATDVLWHHNLMDNEKNSEVGDYFGTTVNTLTVQGAPVLAIYAHGRDRVYSGSNHQDVGDVDLLNDFYQ